MEYVHLALQSGQLSLLQSEFILHCCSLHKQLFDEHHGVAGMGAGPGGPGGPGGPDVCLLLLLRPPLRSP